MPPAAIAVGGLAAGAAGSIISGKMAADAQGDAADQQAAFAKQAANQYANIDIPTIEQQMLQLEQIKSAGNLTPEQEATINQKESELNSYVQNPEAMTAQMQALQSLQQIGQNNGLTAMDKAQLNQIQNTTNAQEKSNRGAILQNFAQRGMGGSGVQLAAELAGNQAAGETAANQGFNVAAQAQQRALQAIQGAGQLGGNIEQQQFGEAGQKAAAQNAINQFNTANAQNVLGQNVQRANYAQQANLQNQQQLNAANTTLANQQQTYNKGLYQQGFGNEMQKAQGMANALGGQANAAATQGNAAANLYSGMGQAAAKIGTGIADYGMSQNKATPTTDVLQGQQIKNADGSWSTY